MAGELCKVIGGKSIRARDGDHYVNATEMCKAAGKQWAHYHENKGTKEFLEALAADIGIPMSALVESNRGGSNRGGTWIHPRVVIHFVQWASAEFAAAVTGWVLDLITTGKVELQPGGAEVLAEDLRKFATLNEKLVRIEETVSRLLAAPKMFEPGTGARIEGPFWTVAAWLEENMPDWNTTPEQRHAIGQDAKRRVHRACPKEQVGYFNRDLAFVAHQEFYLAKAAQHVHRKAMREGKAQTFGLFADDAA